MLNDFEILVWWKCFSTFSRKATHWSCLCSTYAPKTKCVSFKRMNWRVTWEWTFVLLTICENLPDFASLALCKQRWCAYLWYAIQRTLKWRNKYKRKWKRKKLGREVETPMILSQTFISRVCVFSSFYFLAIERRLQCTMKYAFCIGIQANEFGTQNFDQLILSLILSVWVSHGVDRG